jgi:hypothetical protein
MARLVGAAVVAVVMAVNGGDRAIGKRGGRRPET